MDYDLVSNETLDDFPCKEMKGFTVYKELAQFAGQIQALQKQCLKFKKPLLWGGDFFSGTVWAGFVPF